jgi:hypothetical protein
MLFFMSLKMSCRLLFTLDAYTPEQISAFAALATMVVAALAAIAGIVTLIYLRRSINLQTQFFQSLNRPVVHVPRLVESAKGESGYIEKTLYLKNIGNLIAFVESITMIIQADRQGNTVEIIREILNSLEIFISPDAERSIPLKIEFSKVELFQSFDILLDIRYNDSQKNNYHSSSKYKVEFTAAGEVTMLTEEYFD